MTFQAWCAVVGVLFLGMALIPNRLERWPLTTSAIYLGVGVILGPLLLGAITLRPTLHSHLLERLCEFAILISLFATGLKLSVPLNDKRWRVPLRLAFFSMILTVGLVTLVGVTLLHLPLGGAMLLGAILSPTDPVLASDVQVQNSKDDDRLRFALTGEAGFNDGTAFPFAMLALGLLGLHDIGNFGWKWLAIDIGWAFTGGMVIGILTGTLVSRLFIYLRTTHKEAVGSDDFVALGLMIGTYGLAMLCHASGFLAVFAAGLALRHTEWRHTRSRQGKEEKKEVELPSDDEGFENLRDELATHPDRAARYMAGTILRFNEALEHVAELGIVVLLGGLLSRSTWTSTALWLAPLLFLVIRPISVFLGLLGAKSVECARSYICWFGIRGIGSLYYLFYAINHGLPQELAQKLTALTFSVVAISIVVHGVSVTPLMKAYDRG